MEIKVDFVIWLRIHIHSAVQQQRNKQSHIHNKWLWVSRRRRRRLLHEIHLNLHFKCYFGANFYECFIFLLLTRSLARLLIYVQMEMHAFWHTMKKKKEPSQIVNVTNVIDCLLFFSDRSAMVQCVNVEVLLHTLYFIMNVVLHVVCSRQFCI